MAARRPSDKITCRLVASPRVTDVRPFTVLRRPATAAAGGEPAGGSMGTGHLRLVEKETIERDGHIPRAAGLLEIGPSTAWREKYFPLTLKLSVQAMRLIPPSPLDRSTTAKEAEQ